MAIRFGLPKVLAGRLRRALAALPVLFGGVLPPCRGMGFARGSLVGQLQVSQLCGRDVTVVLVAVRVALPRWRFVAAEVAQEPGAAGVEAAA